MKHIILKDGSLQELSLWQKNRVLSSDKLSKNFTVSEFDDAGSLLISEVLIDFLQALRDNEGAMIVSSGYRTEDHQRKLQKQTSGAASISPHVKGMGSDIDRPTIASTKLFAKNTLALAKKLKINIRVGHDQYLRLGQTFVHIDVCPEYYGKGKPYHKRPFPPAWEIAYLTW